MVFTSEAWRRHAFDYSPVGTLNAGGNIGAELERDGVAWTPLLRTNRWNPHPLLAAVYDDHIYHHGAGSRLPKFSVEKGTWRDGRPPPELIDLHEKLFARLFADPDLFVAQLQGEAPPPNLAARTVRAVRRAAT